MSNSKHLPLMQRMQSLMETEFEAVNLSSFSHVRVYPDDSAFILETDMDWYQSTLEKNLHQSIPGYQYFNKDRRRFFWRDNLDLLTSRAEFMANAEKHIEIETALTVNIHQEHFCDRFIFCNKKNDRKNFANTYVNDPTVVDRLIECYLQKAAGLITAAEESKFKTLDENSQIEEQENEIPIEAINVFLSKQIDRTIELTQREIKFLVYSIYGLTAKEIAVKEYLSSRTIENILQIAKEKLGCKSIRNTFALFKEAKVYDLFLATLSI